MAITDVRKEKLGRQDLLLDEAGINQTSSVTVSNEGARTVNHINASDLYILAATRLLSYADQTTVTSKGHIEVNAVLAQLLAHAVLTGLPDTTTFFDIAGSGGSLTIKDAAISAAKLATDSVTTIKITDANVTASKLAADAVDGTKLADNAIDSEHYTDGSIDNEHYSDDSLGINELNLDNTGLTLSHFIVAAGKTAAAVGGETSLVVSPTLQSGLTLAASDIVFATFEVNGAAAVHIRSAVQSSGSQITITPSAALTAGDIISYQILRATVAVS